MYSSGSTADGPSWHVKSVTSRDRSARVTLYMVTGPTARSYVGITSKSVRSRWTQHVRDAGRIRWKSALHDAIRKYGPRAFSIESIDVFDTWEAACSAEVETIERLGTFGDGGYNITRGGDGRLGCAHSDQFKRFISAVHTGKVVSSQTRERLKEAHRSRSPEARADLAAKFSAANARRTEEERARISEAIAASKRGLKRSPETIAKAAAARWAKGKSEAAP